jgi:meso-butanediol dehydrogenase / (S,S)-butanediol dehydrogenase / diacetyl reductase
MPRFSGKTVVITGASRGIGAALARRFADEAASVVVSANEPAAEAVAADIVAVGGKAVAHIADVTKKADVVSLTTPQSVNLAGSTSPFRTLA